MSLAWLVVSLFFTVSSLKEESNSNTGKTKVDRFSSLILCTPLFTSAGLERLKNAQRLERREECTSGRKESQISTTFSFFTAASGIGESTLLQAKLTGIPFGPRGPLDPDFPRWPL